MTTKKTKKSKKSKYKLHPKIKKHWKASEDIIRLTLERKNLKCRRCSKKLKFSKKHIDYFIKGFKWGKKSSSPNTWAALPFQILSPIFVHEPYHIVCSKCSNAIYRFMGVIPDKHDHKVFPSQVTTMPEGADVGDWLSSKTKEWIIYYKNKSEKYTKEKYMKYLRKACREYKKKYPYIPYSNARLVQVVKSYKFKDMWG